MAMRKSPLSISVSMQLAGTFGLKAVTNNPYLYAGRRLLPDVEITTLYHKPSSAFDSIVRARLLANMIPKEDIPKVRIIK